MTTSTFFNAPHPLVPLATFKVGEALTPALEEESRGSCASGELALMDGNQSRDRWPKYALFPSAEQGPGDGHIAPDFLGRLHHLKTLLRMSATEEPVSVMIHRVGPLLILDDGPCGWSRGAAPGIGEPLPPLSDNGAPSRPSTPQAESQLTLAALDPSLEMALVGSLPQEASSGSRPGKGELALPELPPLDCGPQLCVKNTFVDIVDYSDEEEQLLRTQTAPGRIMGAACSPRTPGSGDVDPRYSPALPAYPVPFSPVVQRLQEHAERAASTWSLIPYQPEAGGEAGGHKAGAILHADGVKGPDGIRAPPHWDLLQCSSHNMVPPGCSTAIEAVRSLYSGIPPRPSRFGRAVEWRCGPYKILLGCDLVVLHSDERCEFSDFASFRMLPPGGKPEPSREERLDMYLENVMCDITKAVWGSHHQGQTTWRVFNTADLPEPAPGQQEQCFDANMLKDQGQRLLHFLKQKCHREGGTYWLFREQNAPCAELFDLSGSTEPTADENGSWCSSKAFQATPSLSAPLATLCFHLAKAAQNNADQRQLLQKGLHLLEPYQDEHAPLYAMTALQLACTYTRAPLAAIPDAPPGLDQPNGGGATTTDVRTPAAARLSIALRCLESVLRLLMSLEDAPREEATLLAELRLQAHVAYADCVLKLVREACIPTYSAWLSDVQRASQELLKPGGDPAAASAADSIGQMKQLSAAFLLWRLFWLCRAHRALATLPAERRETECWILDRDLCETLGDTLYGLSRFPADDVAELLAGLLATAEGICRLVEEALRSWGLAGGGAASAAGGDKEAGAGGRGRKKTKRLTSPVPGKAGAEQQKEAGPHNLNAVFLSKLNPLERGVGDEPLLEDPLVRDDLRPTLWLQGRAFKQSLAFYERATARLRKAAPAPATGGAEEEAAGGAATHAPPRRHAEDQATVKIARKLAHLYNEEARGALVRANGADDEGAGELLAEAHRWMMLSGDFSNAGRVLLNLSELHARRAERLAPGPAASESPGGGAVGFSEEQYQLWLKAVDCCEEAARLSDGALGRREGAFAHLRVGVHLSLRVPTQARLGGSRREETLAELADRHFSKALRLFDELREEREIAVCHFHMADLALQEQSAPNAQPLTKPRLIAALRHARRSTEYWERAGALQYAKDFVASNIRTARLLECQPRAGATVEALEHLHEAESRLLALANGASQADLQPLPVDLLVRAPTVAAATAPARRQAPLAPPPFVGVQPFRREMSRVCQGGLRRGEDVERLKVMYRRVLRNEPIVGAPG